MWVDNLNCLIILFFDLVLTFAWINLTDKWGFWYQDPSKFAVSAAPVAQESSSAAPEAAKEEEKVEEKEESDDDMGFSLFD